MAAKKMGLGRGFDSLIPTDVLDETFDPTAERDEQLSELRQLRLADVQPDPEQPRRHFDDEALAELAASIREHGIVQPIVVIRHKAGYMIVAGERRWRAAKLAGLTEVPAIVRTMSDQHKLEVALIENLQRRDLNPLETATAYLKLHTQFNLTYEQVAQQVGSKPSTISNILRLLRLPDDAKSALIAGDISEGHARQILALEGDPDIQASLLTYICREGWSVRKAEQFVVGYRQALKGKAEKVAADKAVTHTATETPLTKALADRLSLPVTIKTMAHGGRVIISYKNDAELENLKQLLG